MAYLEYFTEERLELQKELMNHPEVCALISKHPPQEFELRLAEIACYCGVALDGAYSQAELDKLCEILRNRLYIMRVQSIGMLS